jgi:hypothetical protein
MTAAIPIGAFTKKIHRQERPEVSTPPSSGPMATARPVTAPQTPNAMPRSLPAVRDGHAFLAVTAMVSGDGKKVMLPGSRL